MTDADDVRSRLASFADPLAFLEGLFLHAPVPYAVFDATGRCVLTNPAYRAMFGREPPPEYSLAKDEIAAALGLRDLFREALAGRTVRTPTFRYDPKQLEHIDVDDARAVAIACTVFPLGAPEGGRVTHVAIAYEDVTAEVEARDEAEAERDLLRAIVDQSAVGIVVCDEHGRVRVFNRAAERQHGIPAGEALGTEPASWATVFGLLTDGGEPLPLDSTPMFRALGGEVVEDATWVVRRPDGQRRLLTGAATPLRGGRAGGAVLVTRDETERLRAEEALRRSEERFRCLVEATSSIIWIRGPDGTFDEDPRGWTRFTGQTAAEAAGWGWLDAIHPDHREAVRASWHEVVAGGGDHWTSSHRLRRHDGSWRDVDVQAVRVLEADGATREWVGVTTDVTEARAAEELRRYVAGAGSSLAASLDVEAALRAAASRAVPHLADVCLVDLAGDDGLLSRVAAVARDPAGLPGDGGGVGVGARPPDGPTCLAEPRGAALVAALGSAEDAAAIGALRPRALIAVPLRARDRTLGRMLLVITEPGRACTSEHIALAEELADRAALAADSARLYREARDAAARAEAASRAKDEFLAILGHELRNPLAPITTALHLLRRRSPGAERELDLVERQVVHLRRLVDDLLDVSRITRGKVELDVRPVPVAELVGRALELAGPLVEERRHHVDVDLDRAPVTWPMDATRMTQVVVNLLTNAAKYTPEAGRIALVAERAGDELVLRVRDDGIGMTPAQLGTVFEPFVQAEQDLGRSGGGLGLGLTIVRTLAELHGGRVSAASDGPGHGSEFVVRLPDRASEAAPASAQEPRAAGAGQRVLVVDDNVDAAELTAELVRLWGHDARVAHDGRGALALLEDFVPDVALLDIGLPVMDGYELARRIRSDPRLRGVRLVAVTGYGQPSDRERSREAGFDEHLVKPVDVATLEALLGGGSISPR